MTTSGNENDINNGADSLNPAADHVIGISNSLAHGEISRPDRYELICMMSRNRPTPPCFYQLTNQVEFDEKDEKLLDKWRVIVNGIATMTPINPGANTRSAHNELRPVGTTLRLGNDTQRKSPLYPETRTNLFLISTGQSLWYRTVRISRVMHRNHVSFNWREMASFILNDGIDHDAAERARWKISQDYHRERWMQPDPQAPERV